MEKQSVQPGIYPGVPFADYLAMDAINHSVLRNAAKSMAHVRGALDAPPEDDSTAATDLGSALHAWCLERPRYDELVAIKPEFTGEGAKARREAWMVENKNRIHINAEQDKLVKAMSAKISAHPTARRIALNPGETEVVIVWQDKASGVLCKARIDKLFRAQRHAADIKSTRSAAPDDFSRSLWLYGYDTGAAFYEMGLLDQLGFSVDFRFIAVENEYPHECVVYRLGEESIRRGRRLIREWLESYAACQKSGVWPDYSAEPIVLDVPGWVLKQEANLTWEE